MPPRFAYWTILIDGKPTAFRAHEQEELLPTLNQLKKKSKDVVLRWFAQGQLWDSPEAALVARQGPKYAPEKRNADWRPGGTHKDPRDRFKKKNRPERAWSEKDPATQRDRDKPGYAAKPWGDQPVGPARGDRPWNKKPDGPPAHRSSSDRRPGGGGWRDKPSGPLRGDRSPAGKPSDRSGSSRERKPWQDKPAGSAPPNARPWQTKPTGPRAQRKPWVGKPGPPGEGAGFKPRGDRTWGSKPSGDAPRGNRPPANRSSADRPRSGGGWNDKAPGGQPRGDRPPAPRSSFDSRKTEGGWRDKPRKTEGGWRDKPREPRRGSEGPASGGGGRDPNRQPFTPRGPRPGGAPSDSAPRKRRDDED